MELFIPSLLILLILYLFLFLIAPRLSIPFILFLSMVVLVYVLRNHYFLFYNEYRYSTWQYTLQQYAPYVIVFVLSVFIFTSVGITTYTGQPTPTKMPEIPPLPSAASATNSITSAINNGLKTVSETATKVTNTVSNTVSDLVKKNNSNTKNQGSSSTYNLTSLLTSNKNKTNQ
jgi:hypothetical protein